MNTEFQNTKYEIRNTKYASAFSLTEVLIAVGILAVGMLFIAGVFPVSIHFTTVSSERTISAVVADEAFSKIQLYGIPPAVLSTMSGISQMPIESVSPIPFPEFAYPSIPTTDPNSRRYWWSAICRRVGPADVQVTVFVCRKIGTSTKYYIRDPLVPPALITTDRPVAVFMSVGPGSRPDELQMNDLNPVPADVINETAFISDGYTIVDDTGQIYRVLEKYSANPNVIRLDKNWQGGSLVWVVPPPAGGGRYPCIAVYQKVMRF